MHIEPKVTPLGRTFAQLTFGQRLTLGLALNVCIITACQIEKTSEAAQEVEHDAHEDIAIEDELSDEVSVELNAEISVSTNSSALQRHSIFSNASTTSTSLTTSVNQEPIRVLATGGMGFGDLAASYNLMTQMLKLGFNNTFEVIYSGKEKVISLFDLPQDISNNYYSSEKNIRFIQIDEYFNQRLDNQIEPVSLGVTAMFRDNPCKEVSAHYPQYIAAEELQDAVICTNPANFLNANVHISLSNWPVKSEFGESQLFIKDQNEAQRISEQNYFSFTVSNLDAAQKYLTETTHGHQLLLKTPALKTYIHAMNEGSVNIMSVYGKKIRANAEANSAGDDYIANMLQIISGARSAQMQDSKLSAKPLVISVFYDYTKESEVIRKFVCNPTFMIENGQRIKEVMKELNLDQHFLTADLHDEETIEVIKDLKPGQVLLLSMGSLPKIVFDGLYTHTAPNILPVFREGGSSFASLLLFSNAHFRCGATYVFTNTRWEDDLNHVDDPKLRERLKILYSEHGGLCDGARTWQYNKDFHRDLGQFIIEALDPSSSLTQYHSKLAEEARTANRIEEGLAQASLALHRFRN